MKKDYDVSSFLFKASILAISIDATTAGVISGAIPLMQKNFSKVPNYLVESISTLPNLSIMLFVLLSPLITKKMGYKKTVLTGLMLSFLSGIAPFFLHNIYLILASIFIFGAGVGMLNPLSYTIVSYFYNGTERAKMFGFISTVSNLASVLMTALAGILLQISWQTSFLTYFILLGVFLLVFFVVPEIEKENEQIGTKQSIYSELKALNKSVFAYAFCTFVLFSVFMTFNIKISSLITTRGYGSATDASFILSLTSLTGMFIGVIFGFVHKVLKDKIFPLFIFLMGIAFFLIPTSNQLVMTGAMIIMLAGSFSFLATFIFLKISEIVPTEKNNIVSSINLVATNLGAFLAPYTMKMISLIAGNSSPGSALTACGVIVLILLVIVLGKNYLGKNKKMILHG